MEEAARDAEIEIGSLGFSEMMDLVTERLRQSVPLPSIRDFAAEYRENPERFDAMLLEPTGEDLDDPGEENEQDVEGEAPDGG